jgi:hypothetical protein
LEKTYISGEDHIIDPKVPTLSNLPTLKSHQMIPQTAQASKQKGKSAADI